MDQTRINLEKAVARTGDSLRDLSLKLGRNAAYLQQFLARGTPQVLPIEAAVATAQLLGIDPNDLLTQEQQRVLSRSETLAPRTDGPRETRGKYLPAATREPDRTAPSGNATGSRIAEIDAWSVKGDLTGAPPSAEWFIPEGFIRYELRSSPGSLRILLVERESEGTGLNIGDRVILDTSRTTVPGVFALWEDESVVFRRLDTPPEEAKVLGRVLWLSRTV